MKRKITAWIVCTGVLLAMVFCGASCEEPVHYQRYGHFRYIITEDGSAKIVGYNPYPEYYEGGAIIDIPAQIDGHPVRAIGENVINSDSYAIGEIRIPDGIVSIGDGAFKSVIDEWVEIDIPDSVTTIGNNVFGAYLTDIRIPNSVRTIGWNSPDQVSISPDHPYLASADGVLYSKIEKKVIASNGSSIPDGIETIGEGALWPPPESYAVGYYGYWGNSLYIPNSVKTIESNWPPQLSADGIIISSDHPYLTKVNGSLYSKAEKKLIRGGNSIQPGTEVIGDYAFYGLGITDITIPESVTSIGKWAFSEYGFSSNMITIPGNVKTIGDHAFAWNDSLQRVTLCEGVESIGSYAFDNCRALVSVNIPYSVSEMGDNPWKECEALEEIIVPDDHPFFAIENGVLYSKTDKRAIWFPQMKSTAVIPEGIEIIGNAAFYKCSKLNTLFIPESVKWIGDETFRYSEKLSSIMLPGHVEHIGSNAFRSTGIKDIEIPAAVESIGRGAFYGSELEYATIHEGVQFIEEYAFCNCMSMKKVIIPESVSWIGDEAFGFFAADRIGEYDVIVKQGSYADEYFKTTEHFLRVHPE